MVVSAKGYTSATNEEISVFRPIAILRLASGVAADCLITYAARSLLLDPSSLILLTPTTTQRLLDLLPHYQASFNRCTDLFEVRSRSLPGYRDPQLTLYVLRQQLATHRRASVSSPLLIDLLGSVSRRYLVGTVQT